MKEFLALEEAGVEALRNAYVASEKFLGLTKAPEPFDFFSELDDDGTEGE